MELNNTFRIIRRTFQKIYSTRRNISNSKDIPQLNLQAEAIDKESKLISY